MFCQTQKLNTLITKKKSRLLISVAFLLSLIIIIIYWKMESEDNIYIHLPSNIIPNSPVQISNTIGNYITRLPYKRNFSDEWEVGLTQISYTKSWYNIMKDQYLKFTLKNSQSTIDLDEMVPRGNYDTPEELVNTINRIYENFAWKNPQHKIQFPPKLFYEPQSYKIKIRIGVINENDVTDLIYPRFSTFLADILGLTDSQGRQYPQTNLKQSVNKELTENITINPYFPKPKEKQNVQSNVQNNVQTNVKANVQSNVQSNVTNQAINIPNITSQNTKIRQADPDEESVVKPHWTTHQKRSIASDNFLQEITLVEGFREVVLHPISSLYVYCYIIKPVFVGNVEASLLRRVEIPNDKKFGETCEIKYYHPQYLSLVSHEIDSIEVDIRDDTNKPVEFAFGKTVVTLHFRKKFKNVFETFFFR